MRQVYYSALFSIMLKLVKSNLTSSLSKDKPKDLKKIVKIIAKDLVKFEYLRPALLNAERLCEIKSILCLTESLYFDAQVDKSRQWVFDRFVNKNYNKMLYLKNDIETDDPVINARLDQFEKRKKEKTA